MLEIKNLNAGYGDIQVLWNINIELNLREVVALIGSNGVGKTTLINTISGLIFPQSGEITFMGRNITTLIPSERVEAGILQVPEGRKLFSGMSIEDNLLMGAFLIRDKALIKSNMASIYDLFPELKERRSQLAGTLSGGQQQMVAIGRALMGEPRLLLIDEFSLGLAPVIVERLAEAIKQIAATREISILIVEQDVQLGLELSSRGYVLETGKVAQFGPSQELIKDERIREAYLGL